MNCPACDSGDTAVRKTIVVGPAVTRLRSCLDCTSEWTTEETVRLIHKRSRVVAGDQGSPSATNDGHPASSK